MKPRHPRKAMRWEFRTGVLCGWSGCEDAAAMSEAGKLSWALNARCRGNFSAKCRKAGALWPRYDKAGFVLDLQCFPRGPGHVGQANSVCVGHTSYCRTFSTPGLNACVLSSRDNKQ